jgi:hypothetical protein
MSSAVIPEIEEIKKEFRDLQNKYQEYLSKVDPDLIYDLLINAQENPKVTPMYMLEVFTKPGADSQGVRNCIYEKTGMVPSIYDNGTHYVTNQKLTLEMLKEISDHEDVLEVTGVYTGGVGGLGASHEQTDHSGHAYDYDESLFSPISLAEEQEEELGAGKQQPEAHVPVALNEDRHSVLVAGHRLLDMTVKLPFYANMFSDAGFSVTTDQTVPDALVDSLVISGNETTVAARFTELLAAGLDELNVTLLPITDASDEQSRLMHLIGRL